MLRSRAFRFNALSSAVLAAFASPTALHANTLVADGVTCSLANAIVSANTDTATGGCAAGSGKDLIQVTTGLFTADPPAITTDMDIVGIGPAQVLNNGLEGRGFIIGGESPGGTLAPHVRFSNHVIQQSRGSDPAPPRICPMPRIA